MASESQRLAATLPRDVWSTLVATPGDKVLREIAACWPLRKNPNIRWALRVWIAVHREQEQAG